MEGADPRTDGELLVATAHDPEAFATFYRRHVRGVLAFFRRRTPSAEVASDLTAETFAAALELMEALPVDQRDAVRARVVDGRPYDEIAEELRCSPSVVRKRVSRGLRTAHHLRYRVHAAAQRRRLRLSRLWAGRVGRPGLPTHAR